MARRKSTKKSNRKQLFFGLLIIILMVSSGFGIMFSGYSSSAESYEYNGYSFSRTSQGFQTTVDGAPLKAYYLPQEVDYINVSDSIIQQLSNTRQIDVTSDPESIAAQEIATAQFYLTEIGASHLNAYVRNGFTKENQYNISIITCGESQVPVLVYELANQTSITNQGSCIHMKGSGADSFMRMTTRLVYGVLGVIQ
ncbi:MAG: hypothetical protein ACQESG_08295 [Nanobdellota archaeon]